MRPLLLGSLAALLSLASGCIVWTSHLEPGVARFPESLHDTPRAPIRLQVVADQPVESDNPSQSVETTATDQDAARLAELITEAGIVSEAGTTLALFDGVIRLKLSEHPLGEPGLAVLTALTLGVIPYYGGRRIEATATLVNANGEQQCTWTAAAEARMFGSLLFVAGWNLDALNDLRDNALRGVVVGLAREQRRLLETSHPGAAGRRAKAP